MSDPQSGARTLVPPGGHVLGVYARTDTERGVFKAPANEILRGALQLSAEYFREGVPVANARFVSQVATVAAFAAAIWSSRRRPHRPEALLRRVGR